MTTTRFAVAACLAATVAGCGGAPTDSAAPAALSAVARSAPVVIEISPEPAGVLETYTAPQLWSLLSTSAGNYGATSLEEAVETSELIVVGRLTGFERGDGYGNGDTLGWYAVARFEVLETLHGTAQGAGGSVTVPFLVGMGVPGGAYPEAELDVLRRSIPDEPALLFLVSWAEAWDRTDTVVPGWLAALDRRDLYRTIGAEGGFALVGGHIADQGSWDAAYPRWARELEGRQLHEIRTAVSAAAVEDRPKP